MAATDWQSAARRYPASDTSALAAARLSRSRLRSERAVRDPIRWQRRVLRAPPRCPCRLLGQATDVGQSHLYRGTFTRALQRRITHADRRVYRQHRDARCSRPNTQHHCQRPMIHPRESGERCLSARHRFSTPASLRRYRAPVGLFGAAILFRPATGMRRNPRRSVEPPAVSPGCRCAVGLRLGAYRRAVFCL